MLEASSNELLKQEEELEYVEIEDSQQEKVIQSRYLDESNESLREDVPNYESEKMNYKESFYEREEPKFDEIDELLPRPASRRPKQSSEPTLDVEPLDIDIANGKDLNDKNRPNTSNDLEDPW